MKENHLFIIWSNASDKKEIIIEDMINSFKIINVLDITWSQDKFSENLSRLYGQHLPDASFKQKHCGTGTFTLIIVEDEEPKYIDLDIGNNRGIQSVNNLVYKKKKLYREWTGGGHKIHATNDREEFEHDYFLLLGHQDNIVNYPDTESRSIELIGANGWDSFDDFKRALIIYDKYVILRGEVNSSLLSGEEDIDLLVDSALDFSYLINGLNTGKKYSNMRYTTRVMNSMVHMDLNTVGDGCYCDKWQNKMIEKKVNFGGVHKLDSENETYMNMYHNYVHKNKKVEIFDLAEYLNQNGYTVSEPNDVTVGYYTNDLSKLVSYESKSIKRKLFDMFSVIRVKLYAIKKSYLNIN